MELLITLVAWTPLLAGINPKISMFVGVVEYINNAPSVTITMITMTFFLLFKTTWATFSIDFSNGSFTAHYDIRRENGIKTVEWRS